MKKSASHLTKEDSFIQGKNRGKWTALDDQIFPKQKENTWTRENRMRKTTQVLSKTIKTKLLRWIPPHIRTARDDDAPTR